MLKVDSSKWDARIAALEAENRDLKRDLEASLTADVKKNVAISGNNWNLEKATLRYQEAERQMRSLGQKLQKERAQCRLEQQELETMLFDPTLTMSVSWPRSRIWGSACQGAGGAYQSALAV